MKFIKSFKIFEHQGTGDSTGEDERLYKIRNEFLTRCLGDL